MSRKNRERLTERGHIYHSCEFMDDGMDVYMNKLREYEDAEEDTAVHSGMITLKGSRFIVSQDDYSATDVDYKVFVSNANGCADVTQGLTEDETHELISDLIYCIRDLLKERNAK